MRWVAVLSLCCLPALLLGEVREHDGREWHVSLPQEHDPVAILLWLPKHGDAARADLRWWRQSGLVRRGLVVISAEPQSTRWNAVRDRPFLLRLLFELREETGLGHERVFIGGHVQGAELAQDIALALPQRFAGCLLARGASVVQVPRADPDHPVPIALLGNWNDHRVPFVRLQQIGRTLEQLGHRVRLLRDDQGDRLGPRFWEVVAEEVADRGVELAPPEAPADAEQDDDGDGDGAAAASEADAGAAEADAAAPGVDVEPEPEPSPAPAP